MGIVNPAAGGGGGGGGSSSGVAGAVQTSDGAGGFDNIGTLAAALAALGAPRVATVVLDKAALRGAHVALDVVTAPSGTKKINPFVVSLDWKADSGGSVWHDEQSAPNCNMHLFVDPDNDCGLIGNNHQPDNPVDFESVINSDPNTSKFLSYLVVLNDGQNSGDQWLLTAGVVNRPLQFKLAGPIYPVGIPSATELADGGLSFAAGDVLKDFGNATNKLTLTVDTVDGDGVVQTYTVSDFGGNTFRTGPDFAGTIGLINDSARWAITAADDMASSFSIAGDHTARFGVGASFRIDGSTGNDGGYTVASSSFVGGSTTIVVNEAVPDTTADGLLAAGTGISLNATDVENDATLTITVGYHVSP